MTSTEFFGKVALVTGASGGIGSATCHMLASRGASVALLDLNDVSVLSQTLERVYGIRAIAVQVDVTNPESVEKAFSDVLAWSNRLDLCVNAAGIFPLGSNIDATEPSSWSKVIDVNLTGVFYCLRQELRAFQKLGIKGSVVNLSSDAGSVATAGCAAYVASKHAINGLTKTAAIEYAKIGHRINTVAPGNVDTPMIRKFGLTPEEISKATQPTGRCARPEEVAELICFLLSERSPFMTGSIVAIDGGITTTGYSSGSSQDTFVN